MNLVDVNAEEPINTLKYANTARNNKNKPTVSTSLSSDFLNF